MVDLVGAGELYVRLAEAGVCHEKPLAGAVDAPRVSPRGLDGAHVRPVLAVVPDPLPFQRWRWGTRYRLIPAAAASSSAASAAGGGGGKDCQQRQPQQSRPRTLNGRSRRRRHSARASGASVRHAGRHGAVGHPFRRRSRAEPEDHPTSASSFPMRMSEPIHLHGGRG